MVYLSLVFMSGRAYGVRIYNTIQHDINEFLVFIISRIKLFFSNLGL